MAGLRLVDCVLKKLRPDALYVLRASEAAYVTETFLVKNVFKKCHIELTAFDSPTPFFVSNVQ
jgi:hypothetical protein